MTHELQSAIDNNIGLYRAVLGAQGIDFHVEDGLAYTCERAPTYYSNAVTRSESWTPDEVFRGLERRAEENGWEDWSIKDSFASLDLFQDGFERLFGAEWLYLDPAALSPPREARLRFEVIRTEQALTRWFRSWDADPGLGTTIFRPDLPGRPDFHFVAGYAGADLVAGCILNRTGAVLGLSNCFSADPVAAPWAEALGYVFDSMGATPVVGYARGELATLLKETGFAPIGELQVWRRRVV